MPRDIGTSSLKFYTQKYIRNTAIGRKADSQLSPANERRRYMTSPSCRRTSVATARRWRHWLGVSCPHWSGCWFAAWRRTPDSHGPSASPSRYPPVIQNIAIEPRFPTFFHDQPPPKPSTNSLTPVRWTPFYQTLKLWISKSIGKDVINPWEHSINPWEVNPPQVEKRGIRLTCLWTFVSWSKLFSRNVIFCFCEALPLVSVSSSSFLLAD